MSPLLNDTATSLKNVRLAGFQVIR